MMRNPIFRFTALLRDRKGSSAMEFVLVVPLMFGFFAGSFDLARGVAMKLALAESTARAAEMATGRNVVADSYAYLQTEAQAAYGAPLLGTQVTNWLECDGVASDTFTGKCNVGSQTMRMVTVAATAEYVPVFNWGGLLTGTGPNKGIVLEGKTTVRVE